MLIEVTDAIVNMPNQQHAYMQHIVPAWPPACLARSFRPGLAT